ASAACASALRVVKNCGDCPINRFELVKAVAAATAPEFGVVPGRMTEHSGRFGSIKVHGSYMIKFVCRDSSPLKVSRSGKVTPPKLTAGALPALSCQIAKWLTSAPPMPAMIWRTVKLDPFKAMVA